MLGQAWPVSRLEDVIDQLADQRQAVLRFQLWQINDRGVFWRDHDRLDPDFDSDAPWTRLVARGREAALLEAAFVARREDSVATVEWIGGADL